MTARARVRAVHAAAKEVGDSRLMRWFALLTPLVLSVLSVRASRETKKDTEIVAVSMSTMVQQHATEADSMRHLLARVASLERRVQRVELNGETRRTTARGTPKEPVTEPEDGALRRVGSALVNGIKAGWLAIFGGG